MIGELSGQSLPNKIKNVNNYLSTIDQWNIIRIENKGTYGRIKQNKIFTLFFMTFFVIIFLVAKVQVRMHRIR